MGIFPGLLLGASVLAQPLSAQQQLTGTDSSAALSTVVAKDALVIEEVLVTAEPDIRIFDLAETADPTPDSASLLRKAAGANVVTQGPLTGVAYIRGMSRFRISAQVNGALISPGGPNWMDPPLSYAPAAHLETLEVYRGIVPVAAAQESIGGVVKATTWSGDFTQSDAAFHGRARAGAQSANDSTLLSGALVLSNPAHRLKVSGLRERGEDAVFDGGKILPTRYERDRVDLGYGFRGGPHSLQFDYGHNETGDTGTPALPMDIAWIDSDLLGLGYGFSANGWDVESRVYYSSIDHGMSNYHLRTPPSDPGLYRRNVTDVSNLGFSLTLERDGWSMGLDGHDEGHDSDIDNPNVPAFFVVNFNDAQRQVLGAFLQRQQGFAERWSVEIGLRYNRVRMDAGEVDATPARMGVPPAASLRDAFNGSERSRTDHNLDWAMRVFFAPGADIRLYAGGSRKTRSPAYQERYLWLPLQATAGLADGRTYTGRVDLNPEVAHEAELGVDWDNGNLSVSPRFFYRRVRDYIQGTVSANDAAVAFVRMMDTMNGTSSAAPLEFNNVDAEFYGADLDWRYQLTVRWSLNGIVNYVRGDRRDIDDALYRVAPLNGVISLNYAGGRWGGSIESFLQDAQDRVAATNGEQTSDGYALFNLKGYWQVAQELRLGFGVDNLMDRTYSDHLAGVNRVAGNPAIAVGERLPGYGRSTFLRLDYQW